MERNTVNIKGRVEVLTDLDIDFNTVDVSIIRACLRNGRSITLQGSIFV